MLLVLVNTRYSDKPALADASKCQMSVIKKSMQQEAVIYHAPIFFRQQAYIFNLNANAELDPPVVLCPVF